ncbi:MAG: hypothetical protein A3G81_22545 [Betaproteobacteria bacterium RIFCSPLOWO2_12_FULL_65_14]|nr:MAG: hypothetical protein A3G81_22545 [Betaproteobacteria bacterium RIFCSPLOWO2_12_FULL_65_14]
MHKANARSTRTDHALDRAAILTEQAKDLASILLDKHQSDTDETLTLLNVLRDKIAEVDSIVLEEISKGSMDNAENSNVTELRGNANEQARAREDYRLLHHTTADQLLDDAIRLLSLLELFGDVGEDYPVDPKAVATAASTIVAVLRKAQSHHRDAL